MTEVVRATGLTVRRARRRILHDCHLHLNAGEVVGIYGPNGAGKSSLLQAIACLLPRSTGEVRFHGQVVGRDLTLLDYHRRTAAVFQEPLLLSGTVRENVTLGLRLRGVEAAVQRERVGAWLGRLKIAHLADRDAATLSGGEAQRASLARALVLHPEVLFLDEPFASLDAPTRARLAGELADILSDRGISTFFVTHDLGEAAELCGRCVVVDRGRLLQEGSVTSIVREPACLRVAEITGAPNIFHAVVGERGPGRATLDWAGQRVVATNCPHAVGSRATFLIRPDEITFGAPASEGANRVHGSVERIRARGRELVVSLRGTNGASVALTVRTATLDVRVGASLPLSFPPSAVWVLPEAWEETGEIPG